MGVAPKIIFKNLSYISSYTPDYRFACTVYIIVHMCGQMGRFSEWYIPFVWFPELLAISPGAYELVVNCK